MSVNLTTRYLCKRYLGQSVAATNDDTRIDALIDPVSQATADYCGRVFGVTAYKRWLNGSGGARLLLPQWPVTRLVSVSVSRETALEIQVDTATAVMGSVSISGATLTLQWVTVAGVDATEDITMSGTVADLAALIDAVSGWSATQTSGLTSQPAALLQNLSEQDALAPNSVDLDVPDDPINARVSADSNQSIELGGVSLLGGRFPAGQQNVFVWYVAGYTLPVDDADHSALATAGNVPGNLTLVANQIIQDVLDASKAGHIMAGEEWTNYKYKKAEGMGGGDMGKYVGNYADALAPHMSMRLMAA